MRRRPPRRGGGGGGGGGAPSTWTSTSSPSFSALEKAAACVRKPLGVRSRPSLDARRGRPAPRATLRPPWTHLARAVAAGMRAFANVLFAGLLRGGGCGDVAAQYGRCLSCCSIFWSIYLRKANVSMQGKCFLRLT